MEETKKRYAIVLRGPQDSGKTTILKAVATILMNSSTPLYVNDSDFVTTINYNGNKPKIIGVVSCGDSGRIKSVTTSTKDENEVLFDNIPPNVLGGLNIRRNKPQLSKNVSEYSLLGYLRNSCDIVVCALSYGSKDAVEVCGDINEVFANDEIIWIENALCHADTKVPSINYDYQYDLVTPLAQGIVNIIKRL